MPNHSKASTDVQRQCLLDLVQRARTGLVVHLALWTLIGLLGGFATRVPVFFWCVALAFGASLAGRLAFEYRVAPLSKHRPKRARWVFLILLSTNPAVWGIVGAVSLLWPPLTDASRWLWLVIVGIAASGGMSLAFDPVVRKTYAPLAVVPATVALFRTATTHELFEPIASVIFLLYIYRASKVVHDDYWSAVQSRADLEDRGRHLEHLSATDALTQIANRMHFDRHLTAEWARSRRGAPNQAVITLIMIDIDHFKTVNDRFGHPFGDRCLQAVATALRAALGRPGDLLARFGGEEFVALLPGIDAAGAAVVAARMHGAVAAIAIDHRGQSVKLTCSIGVHTMNTRDSAEAAVALVKADEALYRAKRQGRDQVVVYGAAAPVTA